MPFPALRPDTLRSLVVVGDDGETAVVLRDALPRAMVVVLDSRPAEASAAISVCRPYPWAVAWDSGAPIPAALAAQRKPTILLAGPASSDSPAHAQRWPALNVLIAKLHGMLGATVGGMRLAPGMGVELPTGAVVRSASLQALVSMHPAGVSASPARFRDAASVLAARGLGWTTALDNGGAVTLVPTEPAA